ncbi:MAG: DUF1615 domain-containing protein [Steroidobacteraceae bacterium]
MDAHAFIGQSLPASISDRDGWIADLYDDFAALGIEPSREHVCAVVAVIEQESGFRVDPLIPGLGGIAWREIDRRAQHAGIPPAVVHGVLQLKSPTGQSYGDRIDAAHTEKQLSDIFEDFTGSLPLGKTLFASWNPIRTRGPMQVNVAFAEKFAATHPYPFPVASSVADETFTRRGSVYFGIAHLLAYQAPYDRYLFRFADYNAGQYSSRNAAFQAALAVATGTALTADGALLPHDADASHPGDTEQAARSLQSRLALSDNAIHAALEQGRSEDFQVSVLYRRVFSLARKSSERPLPRAVVPQIELEGPKIERKLTTEWYAHRVDDRFRRCLAQ